MCASLEIPYVVNSVLKSSTPETPMCETDFQPHVFLLNFCTDEAAPNLKLIRYMQKVYASRNRRSHPVLTMVVHNLCQLHQVSLCSRSQL